MNIYFSKTQLCNENGKIRQSDYLHDKMTKHYQKKRVKSSLLFFTQSLPCFICCISFSFDLKKTETNTKVIISKFLHQNDHIFSLLASHIANVLYNQHMHIIFTTLLHHTMSQYTHTVLTVQVIPCLSHNNNN